MFVSLVKTEVIIVSFIDDDSIMYINNEKDDHKRSLSDLDINQYTLYKGHSIPFLESDQHEYYKLLEIPKRNSNYPEQFISFLCKSAPKKIFCLGNLSLISKNNVIMICGARNSSEKARELAYKCAMLIAERGNTIASGYARGIDMAAHFGALKAGGDTIAIVPYGLLKFKVKNVIREVFDIERFLVVSELTPLRPFSVRNALRRNNLLVALSNAVIAIEPGKSGGTWNSAECARKIGKPLYFLEGIRKSIIPKLESMGGKRLNVNFGTPDLKLIYEEIG